MSVRVRLAPSPTGDLHIGSLRTLIYNYLVARKEQGTLIVRVEDTDQARLVPGALERQLEAMQWMGLVPDEGVYLDGQGKVTERGGFGPYIQSQRLEIYRQHAEQLLESGKAYRCFCTPERLEQMRNEQQANHLPPRYDRRCRTLSKEISDQRAANEPHVMRQAMPLGGEVKFRDLIRGHLTFPCADLDDQVLVKTDGFPTYHLAAIVDDHLMEISHVLRGEEWLPSTPKHILLFQSFGWDVPLYGHLPVILGPDGKKKLSKRDGDVAVQDYQEKGYLPEALINFLAFLGWSPGTEQEFFTLDGLAKAFDISAVQKAPAKFDFVRLDYVNGWYIRHLPVGDVAEYMLPYLEKAGLIIDGCCAEGIMHPGSPAQYRLAVAGAVQERLKHFDESEEASWFFFKRPTVDDALKTLTVPKKGDAQTTNRILGEVISLLESHSTDQWTHDALMDALTVFTAKHGYKNGDVLWPVRAALTGVPGSPGSYQMLEILGRQESLLRLRAVVY